MLLTQKVLAGSVFSGGDGSATYPYRIETCAALQAMNTYPSAYYVMTDNIDCTDTGSFCRYADKKNY
jgi:hypothetical protein